MNLIGITGRARSGKDTAASFLQQEFGYTPVAFATPMKKMAAVLTDEHVQAMNHDALKEGEVEWLGMTRRRIMQLLGNDAMKPVFGDDIWVRHLMHRLDTWYKNEKSVIVTDIRFDHEAHAIMDRGGFILRMHRDVGGLNGEAADHASERGIDPDLVDFDIDNNGTIGELKVELRKIAEFVAVHGGRR